jgi:hypothetical protein
MINTANSFTANIKFVCLNRKNVLTCIWNFRLSGVHYQLKGSPTPKASQPQKTTVMTTTPQLSHVTIHFSVTPLHYHDLMFSEFHKIMCIIL